MVINVTNKLKPCPFCGSDNVSTYKNGGFNGVFIYCKCDMCGATTKSVKAIDCGEDEFWETNAHRTEVAETRWNNRHNADEPITKNEFRYLMQTVKEIKNKLNEIDNSKKV